MSVKDMIKKSILQSDVFSNMDIGRILISLLVAILLGCFIYMVYRRFYAGVIFSRSFAVTLVGMCVLTCMVTLAISTNIVISLGMVGALSIVRFRSAIKEPLDTGFIFWAVACGITSGAGLYLISGIAAVFVAVVFILLSRVKGVTHTYLLLVRYEEKAGADVLRILGNLKKVLKNKTSAKGMTELTYEVKIKVDNTAFVEELTALDGVESATIVEFTGDYCA